MAKLLFIILVSFLPIHCFAQAGKSDPLWASSWTEEKEVHKAVVEIWCRLDPFTTTGGSGVLIGGKLAGTAFHVVDGAVEIKVKFHDGTSASARIKNCYADCDFATLEITGDVPATCASSKIAECLPEVGDDVEVCGFSGGSGLRHFSAKVLGTDGQRIVIAGYVAQGDSGGPVFNANGEVVSVVSGGSVWLQGKTVNGKLGGPKVTTPIAGPAVQKFR